MMNIAVFQLDILYGCPKKNIENIKQQIIESQFEIAVLPELCTSGSIFLSHDDFHSMAIVPHKDNFIDWLISIAQKKHATIIAGIIEQFDKQFYNSACLINPNGLINTQRKVNLPTFETRFFESGRTFHIFELYGRKTVTLVCYDIWFDSVLEEVTSKGAEIIFNIANFCGEDSVAKIVEQAIKFKVHIVVANRVGMDHENDHGVCYIGHSFIVNPKGKILTQLDDKPGVLTFKLTDEQFGDNL